MPEPHDRTTPEMSRVFLCHSSADKPTVRELYSRLQGDGVNPWFDEEDLLPGQLWEKEIPKAVRSSSAVIVCVSRNSVERAGYVQKEVKCALDAAEEQPEGKIFLIPARLEECPMPERLKHLHWVNLFEPNGYDRLLRALGARGVIRLVPRPSSKLRFTVHRALFLPSGPECFFLNATNITADSDVEVTHIWIATSPEVHVLQRDRPLPKRLKPQETWETWIRVDQVPGAERDPVFDLARARLSTGEIVNSKRNDGVPSYGTVPGGVITSI
jgi:hypothetical protein